MYAHAYSCTRNLICTGTYSTINRLFTIYDVMGGGGGGGTKYNLYENMHVLCFHVLNSCESTKNALFSSFSASFYPHYIIILKDVLVLLVGVID